MSKNTTVAVPILLYRRKRILYIVILTLLLCCMVFLSILTGTSQFSIAEIMGELMGKSTSEFAHRIIMDIRLPRVLTAMLVGMNLSAAGVLLQGILRNPLASPQVVGVNAGAGLSAVIIMVLFPGMIRLLPTGALLGALCAVVLVYGISYAKGKDSEVNVVLAGMSIAALLGAFTSGLMIFYSDQLEVTYTWLIGGLAGRGWSYFNLIWPYSIAGIGVSILISPKLNLFLLGDEVGKSLGLSTVAYRMIAILLSALLGGSAVSVGGTIGFIGLMAPHIARLLVGRDHRYLLIMSIMLGAFILVTADLAARTIFQPVELPVGIITAGIGAPFFIYLLFKNKRNL